MDEVRDRRTTRRNRGAPNRHALRSAAIAFGARIGRAALLRRPACQTGARLAGDRDGRLEFFEKDRPREVEPLRVADLGRGLQIGQLLEGLDAFGDHGHAERFAQRFDRPQDALAARALDGCR